MRITSLFLIISLFFSCKDTKKSELPKSIEKVAEVSEKVQYPEVLQKVFEAHGGLKNWKSEQTLSYEMPSENGVSEKQVIDLYTRKDKIVNGTVEMGFDGTNVWLLDADKSYKGDPVFYHNLMFYFYAMPFVLADNGIIYGETEPLVFEGKTYPGISISYNPGVGVSYKDEYYLHYDPETYQMAWLGYTVSYRSGEKSDNVKWIRYNDWMKVNNVVLPKSITWYAYEGKTIKEPKNTVQFENIVLSNSAMVKGFYNVPENAVIVQGKQQ
tara:strand:+ start:468 stop:1274 length:807 start_codon:yes stop_codon:yes gene_type:complete